MGGTTDARLAAANASQDEGDRICLMVRDLLLQIARDRGKRPDPVRGVEPTGITVAIEMAPYVERRSTDRNVDGGRVNRRRKAS